MKIGLIDLDGHNFPNLPLMKISTYHKGCNDSVEMWTLTEITELKKAADKAAKKEDENQMSFYDDRKRYDKVYLSKVFASSTDYSPFLLEKCIRSDEIITGGTGFDLKNKLLPEIEHACPDYSLYPQFDEAYGFLTRGCPRGCPFCIVPQKEGRKSVQVSDTEGFHRGQREIKLLDPNLLACKDHEKLLQQLIASKAWVDFTQGLDARLLNADNINLLQKVKTKMLHFAWDNEKDSNIILSSLQNFKRITNIDERKARVYVLTNYNTTFEFDLFRVNTLRKIGFDPYVMIYDKPKAQQQVRYLQRWVNNKRIFRTIEKFEDYNHKIG